MKRIVLTVIWLCALSAFAMAQQKPATTDPLKPYTKCAWPGDLEVKEIDRRPKSDAKFREVRTAQGMERISVLDGYRVMFSFKGLPYYFANVKIEQSDSDSYARDKEINIASLKYLSIEKQVTPMILADESMLNGFAHFGIDRDRIDVGGVLGIHVLFDDIHHLVITIYFLNQGVENSRRSTTADRRRFHNIEEYRLLRDDFLARYSECLRKVADFQG